MTNPNFDRNADDLTKMSAKLKRDSRAAHQQILIASARLEGDHLSPQDVAEQQNYAKQMRELCVLQRNELSAGFKLVAEVLAGDLSEDEARTILARSVPDYLEASALSAQVVAAMLDVTKQIDDL